MMPRMYFKLEEVLKTQPGKTEIHNHVNNTILSLGKKEIKHEIKAKEEDQPPYIYKEDQYYFVVERVVNGKRVEILRTSGYSLEEQMQALTCFMNNTQPMPLEEAKKHLQSQQWSDLLYEQERTAHNKRHRS